MTSPDFDEQAALHALGMLTPRERELLLRHAESDPEAQAELKAYLEAAAELSYGAPQVEPPPSLRRNILAGVAGDVAPGKVIAFPRWITYAVAACLMGLAVYQWVLIQGLSGQVRKAQAQALAAHNEAVALRNRNMMAELRLAELEAKDASYGSTKIMVAWDPKTHRGMISMENMPLPPPGHDYQLWVLDPTLSAPISAGLLHGQTGSRDFAVRPVSTEGPGFAISLEPTGGRPVPTGAILFAVAPGA